MKSKLTFLMAGLLLLSCNTSDPSPDETENEKETEVESKAVSVGVYYFDGWSGKSRYANDPAQPWTKNAPTHLTKRLVEEFPEREPVWGWRNDSQEIMERQIDLAAENGVDFFLFCWYWRDNQGRLNEKAIDELPHHTSLKLYLNARNKKKIKFALLVANHAGSEIIGTENWQAAIKYWAPYLKDKQYVKADGKPLIVLFGTGDEAINNEQLAAMQAAVKKEGFSSGISIAGCGSQARKKAGFTHTTHYNVIPGYASGSEEHKYQELVDATKAQWSGTTYQPYIPLLTAGWDKRPWEGPDGLDQAEGWYYPDRTPEQFKQFLEDAVQWMKDHPTQTSKERLVLVYAWNELGEGGYLVPTKGDPEAVYLKQIKNVVEKENNTK